MSALHELLRHLGDRHFGDADHHRSMLALLDRLDLMQTVTVDMRRSMVGDVVDGAIAPDGRAFFVEHNGGQSRLCAWERPALGKDRYATIAHASFISLCGFPDGKTLAYATYVHDVGARLHFGDWESHLIPFRADDGAMFWTHEGQIYAAVRNWSSDTVVALQTFHLLLGRGPMMNVNRPTHDHVVINGKLSWIEEVAVGPRVKVEVVHWGEWESAAFPGICAGSVSVNPKTGQPRFTIRARNGFQLIENKSASVCCLPIVSENRQFDIRQEDIHTPGGNKPWRLVVNAMDDPTWCWSRNQVSSCHALCFLPDSGETVLLINPDTKHRSGKLVAVVIDKDGKEYENVSVEGATGKMRRIGNQIAVEGRNEHGPTVSLFQEGWTTHHLVGSFDRLALLYDNSIAGWHYGNGVTSIQHYV